MIKKIIFVLIAVFVGIQFVPVSRTNPPVTSEVPASPEVRQILQRACYNCHSNETAWPWYSHVAPVSWLVTRDVHDGRKHVNLSEWDRLTPEYQKITIHEMMEEIEEGEMPLWFYVPLHPEAKLNDSDMATLEAWAKSQGADEASEEDSHSHHDHS